MPIELKVPEVGESITEVMIGTWKKREGDTVAIDDSIVEIESDKATVDLPAPRAGTVTKVLKGSGEKAKVGEVIGYMEPAGALAGPQAPPPSQPVVDVKRTEGRTDIGSVQPPRVMPAAARVLGEAGVPVSAASATGPGGRVTKSDALAATAVPATSAPAAKPAAVVPVKAAGGMAVPGSREERYVLISPIRQRIAERLVEAQHQAALLTTFNEVDMSAVMGLRAKFKDVFQERHGVKLGFMSFFVRAAVECFARCRRSTPSIASRTSSTTTTATSASPSAAARASSCRCCATPRRCLSPASKWRSTTSPGVPQTTSSSWTSCRGARSRSPTAASTAR